MYGWVLGLALAVLPAAPQEPRAELWRAVALHEKGDLEGAVRAYRAYLATEPDSVEARSNLGAALSRAGRFDEAISEYNAALQRAPGNAPILLNLALAYYKSGRVTEAVPRFELAASLAPQFRDQVALLLASSHLRLEQFSKALAVLAPLESRASNEPAFQYLYGTALVGAGQTERGAAQIEKILQRGDSAEARLLQATLELQRGDRESARAHLEQAAALNPRLPAVHVRLGEILMGLGESGRAREEFRQELSIDPSDFQAHQHLGVLARQEQDYDEARAQFEQALRVRPADTGVRFQIAGLDVATGRLDEARRRLTELLAEAPRFTEAHSLLATVFYRMKQPEQGDRERAAAQRLRNEQESAGQAARPRGGGGR